MKLRAILCATFVAALSGCGPNPRLELIDMTRVEPSEIARSLDVRVFSGANSAPPSSQIERVIGFLTATSCKHLSSDPPATTGDALRQLRVKALRIGANAVINVFFEQKGTDPFGANCWESVVATGEAVVLK